MAIELKSATRGNRVAYSKETVYECFPKGPVGIAFALIKESDLHYHKKATEWYLVTRGTGIAYLNGKSFRLKENSMLKIPPTTRHTVRSKKGIAMYVISIPPWSKKDHHIVRKA